MSEKDPSVWDDLKSDWRAHPGLRGKLKLFFVNLGEVIGLMMVVPTIFFSLIITLIVVIIRKRRQSRPKPLI